MQNATATVPDLETSETHDLIASDKVIGTNVYGADNNHIGSIERLMLEKRGGRVSYAVLSFGGFLGIGDDHYPLPWEKLDYDEDLGGYRVDITEDQLKDAPRYNRDEEYDWTPDTGRRIHDFYGVPPYWV